MGPAMWVLLALSRVLLWNFAASSVITMEVDSKRIPSRNDAFQGCFLQLEGSYGDILVPVQYYFDGRPTWRGVDSENGNYVSYLRLFYYDITWVIGPTYDAFHWHAVVFDRQNEKYEPEVTCFDDSSNAIDYNNLMQSQTPMYRLLAPYYTTCRPKRGEPDLQMPHDVIPVDFAEPKSLRDCVAAAATSGVEFTALTYDEGTEKCYGVVDKEASLSVWNAGEPNGTRLSCVVGCLPLQGMELSHSGLIEVSREGGSVATLSDCESSASKISPEASGTKWEKRSNAVGDTTCYAVRELKTVELQNTENGIEAAPNAVTARVCFSPRNLYKTGAPTNSAPETTAVPPFTAAPTGASTLPPSSANKTNLMIGAGVGVGVVIAVGAAAAAYRWTHKSDEDEDDGYDEEDFSEGGGGEGYYNNHHNPAMMYPDAPPW